jgi:hypothetical protein
MKHVRVHNHSKTPLRLVIEPLATLFMVDPTTWVDVYSEFIEEQNWVDVGINHGLDGLAMLIWATEDILVKDMNGNDIKPAAY